ncbi:MAG: YcxB family protein [Desulfobacteraceae bacterium]|nr:YcxB family protein [Desulfobacteraceae bacterium]
MKKQKELKGFINGSWLDLIVWLALILFFYIGFTYVGSVHYPTAILISCIFLIVIGLWFWNLIRLKRALAPSEQGPFLGKHHYLFDEAGIQLKGKGYKRCNDWYSVKSIERGNGMIMLFIDTAQAFIFPENQIDDIDEFMKNINRRIVGEEYKPEKISR